MLRELQARIGAPAILGGFSRLFVDLNRDELKVSGTVENFGVADQRRAALLFCVLTLACFPDAWPQDGSRVGVVLSS